MVAARRYVVDYQCRADRLGQHFERRQLPELLRMRGTLDRSIGPDLEVPEARPLGDGDREPGPETVAAAVASGDVRHGPAAGVADHPQPQKRYFCRRQARFTVVGFGLQCLMPRIAPSRFWAENPLAVR
jgi:hypothetical protein